MIFVVGDFTFKTALKRQQRTILRKCVLSVLLTGQRDDGNKRLVTSVVFSRPRYRFNLLRNPYISILGVWFIYCWIRSKNDGIQ